MILWCKCNERVAKFKRSYTYNSSYFVLTSKRVGCGVDSLDALDSLGKIFPYAVNLEDENGMKVSADISVLDNNGITTPLISDTYMGTVTSQDSRALSIPTESILQIISVR